MEANVPRVLVCEDNLLLADTLVDVLARLGCRVVVSVGTVGRAMDAVRNTACDFAVVDLDLQGRMAWPVLDSLERRGTAYIVATCLRIADIPQPYASAPMVPKPYDVKQLRRAVDAVRRRVKYEEHTP
ncbi:response regulator receiver domain-containing protein [Luteibacter rhizovicinus]|uniref:Response regulator receiver domain-containing protein n=1 Tax=Luteibacter rhizovicinus TaxID=242606 RepID=A0A4R3YLN1_9GAMM|nr:hypothetical protein [Luteibacter rhizovicinus]TCV92368.1 response regulator receiver domain-containing protein [Luteibacter rhizovicinus]